MGSEETYLELIERFPNVREAEEENPISRLGLESARPQHQVRITRPYYMSAYEVTNAQFKKFTDATPHKTHPARNDKSSWGLPPRKGPEPLDTSIPEGRDFPSRYWGIETSDQAPVVNVSWIEAVAFCDWLSRKEGQTYRLPTEAEWEYACRAGTTTPFNFGAVNDGSHCNCNDKGAYPDGSAPQRPALGRTIPVGSYRPNAFGLFDMHGNVWEWCWDTYDERPQKGTAGARRVNRGGSWGSFPVYCRSAVRGRDLPTFASDNLGFRVARSLQE
jgi:formylglycine-generating enzyme required for sulfatase activity